MHNRIYRTKTAWESSYSNSPTPVGHWLIFYKLLLIIDLHLQKALPSCFVSCCWLSVCKEQLYFHLRALGPFRICRVYAEEQALFQSRHWCWEDLRDWGLVLDSPFNLSTLVCSRWHTSAQLVLCWKVTLDVWQVLHAVRSISIWTATRFAHFLPLQTITMDLKLNHWDVIHGV